jgi:UDP-N-acetylenolpyruvoylglucosamine reductase
MAARLQTDKRRWKDEQQRVKQREDEERRCKQQQDELLSYGSVFKSADMSSNKGTGSGSYKKFEEDFF